MYEVTCPQCNKKIAVSENQLLTGEVECPDCNAVLEFDLDGIADDEEEPGILSSNLTILHSWDNISQGCFFAY